MEAPIARPVPSWALLGLAPLAFFVAFACGGEDSVSGLGYQAEVVVADANLPVALAAAPDGRLFYAEQTSGLIRVITADGTLVEQPFAQVESNFAPIDLGLLGLALDPDFESNGYVYAFYTQQTGDETSQPTIVRFTDQENRGVEPTVLMDDLPETVPKAYFNTVAAIHFGPDGYLYVSLGDYDQREFAQDLKVVQGKILRVSKEDGSAPPDNPLVDDAEADHRIFAYGLRKVFDFAFHPDTGEIYAPDGNSTTCDELNIIRAGQNYGWPMSYDFRFDSCTEGQPTPGIHLFAQEGMEPLDNLSVVSPAGVAFVSGEVYPGIGDGLLVCERATGLMRRLVLEGPDQDEVVSDDVVVEDCSLDVTAGPDGTIFYTNLTEVRRLVPE